MADPNTPTVAVIGPVADGVAFDANKPGVLIACQDGTLVQNIRGDSTGRLIIGQVIPGGAAADLGKAESAVHTSGDTGVMALAVRQDAVAALAADGQYSPLQTDANGRLKVADPNAGAGTPTSPVVTVTTVAAVAAGGTSGTSLQTADLGGLTRQLAGIDITAGVPLKIEIQEVVNGVASNRTVLMTQSGDNLQWRPPHKAYFNVVFAANAGFDGWRVLATNKHAQESADIYATFYVEN